MKSDLSWQELGTLYGYPQCCINEFLIEAGNQHGRKLKGTGYVPCRGCNKKDKKELLEVIRINRKFPLPFPEDSFRKAFPQYYKPF
jgi:hypothetical protein